MRRIFALVAVLAAFSTTVAVADQPDTDSRSTQTVTIECSGVRLHTAIERIAAKTGVVIRTGSDSTDWKVRDLPVLICSRDLPLDRLLRAIADTNHLLLSSKTLRDVRTYRVWRDLKRQQELDDLEDSRKSAAVAATEWDWNTLCRVKDLPEEAFNSDDPFRAADYAICKAVGNVLSQLGPEARDRILSGETVVLGNLNTPAKMKPYTDDAQKHFWEMGDRMAVRDGRERPKPLDELGNAPHMQIRFGRQLDYPDQLSVELWQQGYMEVDHWRYERWAAKYIKDLPPRPTVPPAVSPSDELGAPYVKLDLEKGNQPAFLTQKFKVPKPKDKKTPTYQDLLVETSSATGYSIIAEGNGARYRELVMSLNDQIPKFFDRDTTLKEVLGFSTGIDRMDWYLDARHKLIIGRDREWTVRLAALVSEKLILDLHTKLNGKGLDLDDFSAVSRLTSDQIRDWFYISPECPEMARLSAFQFTSELFRLYFDLSPSLRKRAMAGETVTVTFEDLSAGCSMLRRLIQNQMLMLYLNSRWLKVTPSVQQLIDLDSSGAAFEPDKLPQMRLKLEKPTSERLPKGKHFYRVTLLDAEGNTLARDSIGMAFPMLASDLKPRR